MSDEKRNDDFDEPVDLSDIMRDEQFINALLEEGEVRTVSDEDYALAMLFSSARYEVLNDAVGFEITDDQISAALAEGQRAANPRGRRLLTSLGAGAASVALVLGGLAVVSNDVGERAGDSQSRHVVSASMIRADLDEAQELLNQGEVVRGVELLNATTGRMDKLDRTAEFHELNNIRVHLWSRATGQPESAAPAVGTTPTVPTDLPRAPSVAPSSAPTPSLPQITLPPLPSLPQSTSPGQPGSGQPSASEAPTSTTTTPPVEPSVSKPTVTPAASSSEPTIAQPTA